MLYQKRTSFVDGPSVNLATGFIARTDVPFRLLSRLSHGHTLTLSLILAFPFT